MTSEPQMSGSRPGLRPHSPVLSETPQSLLSAAVPSVARRDGRRGERGISTADCTAEVGRGRAGPLSFPGGVSLLLLYEPLSENLPKERGATEKLEGVLVTDKEPRTDPRMVQGCPVPPSFPLPPSESVGLQ